MDIIKFKQAQKVMSGIADYNRYIDSVEGMRRQAIDEANKNDNYFITAQIEAKYIDDLMPIYDKMAKELIDKRELLEKEFEEI